MPKPLKHGDELKRPALEDVQRFLSKVVRNGTDCWEWRGCARGRPGSEYGQFKIGGRAGRAHWAHRVSFAIFNGQIGEGLDVHHRCENTLCVNPDHLESVTRGGHGVIEGQRKRGEEVPF